MHGRTAIACLLLAFRAGPAPASQDPLNRDTPQSSAAAFLGACRAHDYQRAWRYIDLRKLPIDERLKNGVQIAQELQQILERDSQFDIASLSKNADGDPPGSNRERVDAFTLDGKTVALDMERVTLRSGAAVWLFSSASVDLIPRLARMLSDSAIERHLPGPLVTWKVMDTPTWRWIALLLLAVTLAAVSKLVSRLAIAWLGLPLRRLAPRVNANILVVFAGPLQLLLVVAGFRAGMGTIGPSPSLRPILERCAALLFFSALAWLGMRAVDVAAIWLRALLESRHRNFGYSVLPLASRAVKIAILAFSAAAILSNWGYNTATILAGLGIGGVALALAAQKTIENLFGGVAVITDQPVSIGDFCRVGDQMGTVEDIGLRSTRIRTLNRTILTVPNGQFSSMALENFSKRDKMWFHLTLNLRRDTTSDQVRTLLESITQTLVKHPKVEAGAFPVRFVGVGTYSLDLEIFAYILTPDYDEFLRIQQDLFLWILDEVEAAGTALAVPTQAYYSLARPDQTGPLAPQHTRP